MAGRPTAPILARYRCFLPDLAGLAGLRRVGPGTRLSLPSETWGTPVRGRLMWRRGTKELRREHGVANDALGGTAKPSRAGGLLVCVVVIGWGDGAVRFMVGAAWPLVVGFSGLVVMIPIHAGVARGRWRGDSG